MIGQAAQVRPWIFREIQHYLETGEKLPISEINEIQAIMNDHLIDHHAFYGEHIGLRTARNISAGIAKDYAIRMLFANE